MWLDQFHPDDPQTEYFWILNTVSLLNPLGGSPEKVGVKSGLRSRAGSVEEGGLQRGRVKCPGQTPDNELSGVLWGQQRTG